MGFLKRRRKLPAVAGSHEPAATSDDIEACFRLILGRPPNPEERAGHFGRVGENLGTVVASYVGSLEFARRGLIRSPAERIVETSLNGCAMFVDGEDHAVGREILAGVYEPDVVAAIRGLLGPGMGMIDLGANIGVITLLAASIVGEKGYVLAVEPNPRNARLLEASRRKNCFEQVTVCQCAAGARTGLMVLHPSFSNGTTSSVPDDPAALAEAATVPAIPPDLLVPPGRTIDLIKADVEGAEYLALQGCVATIQRDRPAIVSEFSPSMLPGLSGIDGPGYLAWLEGFGYAVRVIERDGSLSDVQDAAGIMGIYADRGVDHIDIVARA